MKTAIRTGILVLLAAGFASCSQHSGGPRPSGTLEATEVDIASTISGRLLDVRAKLGDHVRTGDTLIVLDTELLQLQRAQNETNQRSIYAQKLVTEDNVKQAKLNLTLATTTLKRLEALKDQGSVTDQQVDEAQAKHDVAVSQVSSGQHQLEALTAEEIKLDALLAVNARQIKDGVILSPLNGTVILHNAEPGEVAASGAVLLRLADLQNLVLRVYLSEQDVSRAKVGQEMSVLMDALKNETLKGRVTWVSAEAEFTPKNVQTRDARTQLVYAVKLSVSNPDGRLHIGMPAEVQL
jgi:HlyD family secretion protein